MVVEKSKTFLRLPFPHATIRLMIILGIDSGTARTGYGVLKKINKVNKKCEYEVLGCGCITTSSKESPERRIEIIFKEVEKIIRKQKPNIICLEELFFNTNVKTAMSVGRVSGAVMLLAAKHKIKVVEYTPLQVKVAITGYGRADKSQMQKMIKTLLKLSDIPKPDDAADALAVALCHAVSFREVEHDRKYYGRN